MANGFAAGGQLTTTTDGTRAAIHTPPLLLILVSDRPRRF